jgi:hypothetical protein
MRSRHVRETAHSHYPLEGSGKGTSEKLRFPLSEGPSPAEEGVRTSFSELQADLTEGGETSHGVYALVRSGILSKGAYAPIRADRNEAWLRAKCVIKAKSR